MSAVVESFLLCDGPECSNSFGVDNRQLTIKKHREEAKLSGWLRLGSKDYCPSCSPSHNSKKETTNVK